MSNKRRIKFFLLKSKAELCNNRKILKERFGLLTNKNRNIYFPPILNQHKYGYFNL